MKNPLDVVHGALIHTRRVRVLGETIAALVPAGSSVLDVGCGDGRLARVMLDRAPSLEIRGLDPLVRPDALIPVEAFDGVRIPRSDRSVDFVMFVDVLHHTEDPAVLLREAARVARRGVLLKDHLRDGLLAGPTLRLMDWIGNARHGVVLPYNYWRHAQWHDAFRDCGLTVTFWKRQLNLYPRVLNAFFGRSLHFVARLEHSSPRSATTHPHQTDEKARQHRLEAERR